VHTIIFDQAAKRKWTKAAAIKFNYGSNFSATFVKNIKTNTKTHCTTY